MLGWLFGIWFFDFFIAFFFSFFHMIFIRVQGCIILILILIIVYHVPFVVVVKTPSGPDPQARNKELN